MPRKWKGGIHKHPAGYFAYVPKRSGGEGFRYFNSELKLVEQWQAKKGMEEWGKDWPHVKKHGPVHRILSRRMGTRKSVQVEPGIRYTEGVHPQRGHYEKKVMITFMEVANGVKRQRSRSFTYDSHRAPRTQKEAIQLARALLYEKRSKYSDA